MLIENGRSCEDGRNPDGIYFELQSPSVRNQRETDFFLFFWNCGVISLNSKGCTSLIMIAVWKVERVVIIPDCDGLGLDFVEGMFGL